MITNPNIQAALRDKADHGVWDLVGDFAPVNGAGGTGTPFAGPGSTYTRYDAAAPGAFFVNTGTALLPIWTGNTLLATAASAPPARTPAPAEKHVEKHVESHPEKQAQPFAPEKQEKEEKHTASEKTTKLPDPKTGR